MKYLDTNVIIYAIENESKYGKACKKILQDIEANKLEVSCSMLVLIEVLNVLTKINRILKEQGKEKLNIRKNIEAILSLPIKWLDINFVILKRAADYEYKVSGIDYVHISSMEINSITEILSADKELNKIEVIKRIDPLDY